MPIARRKSVRPTGRILWLTEDADLLCKQLDGGALDQAPDAEALIDNISTDELTPGWVCYYYDETLARYCLVGLRGGHIKRDGIKNGGFGVIVSGRSKGCGSSRETAPYSEREAGIQIVVARSIEKIYGQNCQNIGLLTTTDFGIIDRLAAGEEIPIGEFTQGLDPISVDVVEHGGLFHYNQARLAGQVAPPAVHTAPRPMTVVEKIIANHAIVDAQTDRIGLPAVKPGDSLFLRCDVRFSHEYVTPMADALFRDGIKLYGEVERDGKPAGSEGICHSKVIEDLALPGDVVLGTDSHTCNAGAVGCFAFGVGSTDMANAWFTRDARVAVPQSVRFMLTGALPPGAAAKDVMLHILAQPYCREGELIGKVLEFQGPGVATLPLQERATLTNMAVETGGFTAILEPDDGVVQQLAALRGMEPAEIRSRIVRADDGAEYARTIDIDLSSIEPMVATPGDPRNGILLRDLEGQQGGPVPIDIAYGGSCTGGKASDMDMYAAVLKKAVAEGKRVAEGVRLYIQFGSQAVRDYAIKQGYVEIFEQAGAILVDPSCGACIKAGPGVSDKPGQVTVSAINRNFSGRSGPGDVYLASPLVVAASAIAGRIVAPDA